MKKILTLIHAALKRLWKSLSHNLLWKIVSVVCALFFWSYIVSVDSTITTVKTLANVPIVTSGLTVLQSRDLALLTDVSTLENVHARVETSQSNYTHVTGDTVRAELDLSQITKAGVHRVELVGVTSYGQVVQLSPSSVEVTVESRGSRYVPVNVELTGDMQDSLWYNISRTNPAQVLVSGPSSLLQTAVSARVQVDVTGQTASYDRSAPLVLLDGQGEEIASSLTASPSFIMMSIEVYPKVQLSVSKNAETATVGTLPEGYELTGIEVQPETITVAAEQSLLDALEELSFDPINLDGRTSSFTAVTTLNALRDMRYVSSEQVTVTVYISESTLSDSYQGLAVVVRGKAAENTVTLSLDSADVRLTGPYSLINRLNSEDLNLFVDVTDLEPGVYDLPISVLVDGGDASALECELDPAVVTVTIEKNEPADAVPAADETQP